MTAENQNNNLYSPDTEQDVDCCILLYVIRKGKNAALGLAVLREFVKSRYQLPSARRSNLYRTRSF